jgi:uncharacterized protein YndB with AHSA1/START domain
MDKIIITATIAADRVKSWHFYTSPAHITQWNFASPDWHCSAASNDLKAGGKYIARMEAKDGSFGFDLEAVYDQVLPYEKLVFHFTDSREVMVDFMADENKTNVTITFDPETINPVDLHREGWQTILNNFKKYTESV